MGGVVFHFTDTIHLPWIIESGELRPNRGNLPGVGPLRYLWGTTNPEGDYTAGPLRAIHGTREEEWQAGVFELVRFTLPADAFLTWGEIVREFSDWTPEEVAELVEMDRREYGEYGHDRWRLRWDTLRLADVIKAEATSYDCQKWWPLDIRRPEKLLIRSRVPNRLGVRIGRRRFHSTRTPCLLGVGASFHPWPDPDRRPAKRAAAAYERRMDAAMIARWNAEEEYEPAE